MCECVCGGRVGGWLAGRAGRQVAGGQACMHMHVCVCHRLLHIL